MTKYWKCRNDALQTLSAPRHKGECRNINLTLFWGLNVQIRDRQLQRSWRSYNWFKLIHNNMTHIAPLSQHNTRSLHKQSCNISHHIQWRLLLAWHATWTWGIIDLKMGQSGQKRRWKWENDSTEAALWWFAVILGSVAPASVYSVQSRPKLIALIVVTTRSSNTQLCRGATYKWELLSEAAEPFLHRYGNSTLEYQFPLPPVFALFLLIFAVSIPWFNPCIPGNYYIWLPWHLCPLPPLPTAHWREFY